MTRLAPHPVARRTFLKAGGALFAWSFATRLSSAAGARDPRLLVVILRGGMDGLALLPPLGDADYLAQRARAGLGAPGATLPLNGFFALNANAPTLAELYRNGEALFVHAAASPYRGRSHFDGQDLLESGLPTLGIGSLDTGWLNRALAEVPRGERLPPPKGLAIAPVIPLIMRGRATVETWQSQSFSYVDDETIARLLDLYEVRDPSLAQGLREGVELDRELRTTEIGTPSRKLASFATEASAAARLMSRPDGPRLGAMSYFGWDTHADQGSAAGAFANQAKALDAAVAALRTGFGEAWRDTAVLVVTEFGRSVRINGTSGTDHGTATAAILLGGSVKGGRVIADWPGLADGHLFEGRDLKPTTDIRAVIKGLLGEHLGLDTRILDEKIFPGSAAVSAVKNLIA